MGGSKMKVTAECPDCTAKLGLEIEHALAGLMGNKVEEILNDDDNQVYCPSCGSWVSPDDAEQVE
jgi:Zn finger protein HypA/HybF involved in hydrogenase expression